MFRVKENPDGSVSIFSNDETPEFICSIGPRGAAKREIPDVPEKTNKFEKNVPKSPTRLALNPIPSPRKRSSNKHKQSWSSKHSDYDDSNDDSSSVSSFKSVVSSCSFASTISTRSFKEPDEDCLDQFSFCQMLNLIESKRLLGPKELVCELQQSFPIRKIACRGRWQDSQKRVLKLTDHVGFSSLLGRNLLCSYPRNKMFEPTENLAPKYDKFCKSSVSELQPVVWRAPLLRTRENRARYQVTFKKNVNYSHEYVFTKKQKKLRAELLTRGLSRRSYILKKKCRKCSVQVSRLSQKTIDRLCNPPRNHVQDTPCIVEELENGNVSCFKVRQNGTLHSEPVVCLEPRNLITNLLRKFGLA